MDAIQRLYLLYGLVHRLLYGIVGNDDNRHRVPLTAGPFLQDRFNTN